MGYEDRVHVLPQEIQDRVSAFGRLKTKELGKSLGKVAKLLKYSIPVVKNIAVIELRSRCN